MSKVSDDRCEAGTVARRPSFRRAGGAAAYGFPMKKARAAEIAFASHNEPSTAGDDGMKMMLKGV